MNGGNPKREEKRDACSGCCGGRGLRAAAVHYGWEYQCGLPDLPPRTALPADDEWGGLSVTAITGYLYLHDQEIAAIPDGGLDGCPYTAATVLRLDSNAITAVGARAFATLAALRRLDLSSNAITWMAPASLDGLTRLERLYLQFNRLGAFDYGALSEMSWLGVLDLQNQDGGDLRCNGEDEWGRWNNYNTTGIAAAVASCGAQSPCPNEATACPLPPPAPPAAQPPGVEELSTGAIGGIVVGAYLGVTLIGGAILALTAP